MEFGVVEYYNREESWGRICTASGEILFFHYNNGQWIREINNKPDFTCLGIILDHEGDRTITSSLPVPEIGDEVVFLRAEYRGSHPTAKEKAYPWGYRAHFQAVVDELLSRAHNHRLSVSGRSQT